MTAAFRVTGRSPAPLATTRSGVARTAPYMHDGSLRTLEEIIEFYDCGGNPNPRLDPEVRPLKLTTEEKKVLVAFLHPLTGEIGEGVEGEADLSHLAEKGVFQAWQSPSVFSTVRLGSSGEIEWPGVGDLCPDALYLRITGKKAEKVFPNLKTAGISA